MSVVARVRFADGGVVMPARSPYDREIVLATVRHCVRRHAAVELELDGRRWRLAAVAGAPAGCARCLRVARLVEVGAAGAVCPTCLAAILSLTAAAAPAAAAGAAIADEPLRGAAAGGVAFGSPSHPARSTRAEELQP